jgi:hypothetical protein
MVTVPATLVRKKRSMRAKPGEEQSTVDNQVSDLF